MTEKKAESGETVKTGPTTGFLATALISAPASGAGTAVMMAASVAATANSVGGTSRVISAVAAGGTGRAISAVAAGGTGRAISAVGAGGATLEIVPRPTITASAPVVAVYNQVNQVIIFWINTSACTVGL